MKYRWRFCCPIDLDQIPRAAGVNAQVETLKCVGITQLVSGISTTAIPIILRAGADIKVTQGIRNRLAGA